MDKVMMNGDQGSVNYVFGNIKIFQRGEGVKERDSNRYTSKIDQNNFSRFYGQKGALSPDHPVLDNHKNYFHWKISKKN